MLGWSGGEWTGADKTGHRHPPQRSSASAWAWPLRAFSRKPRPPLFVCTAGAQQCGNATAVMATRWIIVAVQCTVPCPAAAAAAAWPFFSLSGTAPAPALLAAEEKRHGGAEPMCGTAMSERDDWCSSSSYRPGRSGGRPSALRTGRPDIRTARRLFRRFPTSHSQPLFTRESLPRAVISAYATRASIDHWNVRLGATGAQTLCVWTGTPSLVGA